MQVTSLFATFFAFLTLLAPLATQALQINTPANLTAGNYTIVFTTENSDPAGSSLDFYLVKNATSKLIAPDVAPNAGSVTVAIPANISGTGWRIEACYTDQNAPIGQSGLFAITPTKQEGMSNAGAIVGGVIGGVLGLALIVFVVFFYTRRRRQQIAAAAPTVDLETGLPPPLYHHQRSFSSMSSNSDADNVKAREMEAEKAQWELTLEEQFARARAGTPDISRGMSPMPRGISPMPLRSPPRAVTTPQRDTNY